MLMLYRVFHFNQSIRKNVPPEANNVEIQVDVESNRLITIPKIIHQSWKNNVLPERFQRWHQRWKDLHPNWEVKLWTDEDNRRLVTDYFPWLLSVYDNFPKNIMRADTARYLYLHLHGGVYVDLDFEPLKPIDDLIESETGALMAYHSNSYNSRDIVPNAFMASIPQHPFWNFVMIRIAQLGYIQNDLLKVEPKYIAEHITGPHSMVKIIEEYRKTMSNITGEEIYGIPYGSTLIHDLKMLSPGVIYPFSFITKENIEICHARLATFDENLCKSKYPDAYAITYWQHSWT
jgi:mannosyltransferase OCH1-like enzyme